jgi:penicillin-binding protein 1C
MLAAEDARFYEHHGVDWKSACAALWQDATSLHFRRGGSTITMQLHRLRDPLPHSLFGKFEQAVRAAQIERREGKRQILVEYLNRAPFGGNLVGAGAASWRYFGRPCRDLSLAQAALLAGLPKNPNGDRPDRFPQRARVRRDFILGRMLALGMINEDAYKLALAEPVDASWRALPQRDDPAINAAMPTLMTLARQSAGGMVGTTLDFRIQQMVSTVARNHLEQQGGQITEMAVVVIDTATANCVAVASLSKSEASDLDLTQRPRSTGSVIKPLIYAAAFDAGIVSPRSMLEDSPAAWPGYVPNNYDQQFRGRLSAADALAQSRNIPALRLLSQVGVERAVGICSAMGLETIAKTPGRYGLSLAVGGAEATPLEIAEAYTGLANHGVHRRVSFLNDAAGGTDRASLASLVEKTGSLSPRACRDVLACVNDVQRTAAVCPEAARLRAAWKTGTSSGHRDAWCAVVGPGHVVVVWMGNASAAGSQAIVGADAAAPLALQLIAAIDEHVSARPMEAQPALQLAVARMPEAQLAITSPTNGEKVIRLPDLTAWQQRVMLRATLTNDSGGEAKLHWFMDGSAIGTTAAGEALWCDPSAGQHEVRVVDEAGRADQIRFTVQTPEN